MRRRGPHCGRRTVRLDGDDHRTHKADRLDNGRHAAGRGRPGLLTSGLTVADAPDDPRIRERRSLFDWIEAQGRDLGRSYVSSVERYYRVPA